MIVAFIKEAIKNNKDIICQCEYGQSRSSGCAMAIKQYLYGNGIEIFSDYKYCPSQLIYNKIYEGLTGED